MFKKIIENFKSQTVKAFVENVLSIQEQRYKTLKNEELRIKTEELKKELKKKQNLVDIAPDAFALAKTAVERVYPITVYTVQIEGAYHIALGKISEMETGEGKTITAILAVFLYALAGKGAHIVTVNPYLAQRDYNEMKGIYNLLGLSVGLISNDKSIPEQQEAYAADVTYGDDSCFAFDFLRDNLKYDLREKVQRGRYFGLLDDIDEILIDKARQPLTIVKDDSVLDIPLMKTVNECIHDLIEEQIETEERDLDDYTVDENGLSDENIRIVKLGDYRVDRVRGSIQLTERGRLKIRGRLIGRTESVDKSEDFYSEVKHYAEVLLQARHLEIIDRTYIVEDGQIIIVDPITSRLKPGSKYSEGLHQALEIINDLEVSSAGSRVIAKITYHNYFTEYECIAGMTGTAEFNKEEFKRDYDLPFQPIATNMPVIRQDHPDRIYKSKQAKDKAIIRKIIDLYKKEQPVLVGVPNLDDSEKYSKILEELKIPHSVLNAKNHYREAELINLAGIKGRITIATKLAGRGVDIKIGKGVAELGGLFVLCTERNDEKRIDRQFRGRTGRQGNPGETQFFLSLDDDLLKIFGGERIKAVMDRLKIDDEEHIEHRFISKAIENAQKKVTRHNAEIRRELYEYDNVLSVHRKALYSLRDHILGPGIKKIYGAFLEKYLKTYIENQLIGKSVDQQDIGRICSELSDLFKLQLMQEQFSGVNTKDHLEAILFEILESVLKKKIHAFGLQQEEILRWLALQTLDSMWQSHLDEMKNIRELIGASLTGKENPLLNYILKAEDAFEDFNVRIAHECIKTILTIRIVKKEKENDNSEFIRQEKDKKINQYLKKRDLYSGKKTLLASAPELDHEIREKTEIYDLIYNDKIAHLKKWLESKDGTDQEELKTNLRIFALALRSYEDIDKLSDDYSTIVASFTSILSHLFKDEGGEIRNNPSFCLCLLKFFLQLPKYLDSEYNIELNNNLDELKTEVALNLDAKIINHLFDHIYELLVKQIDNKDIQNLIEPEYFEDLFSQGRNTIYSFLSLTISFVKYGRFFEDIGLLDLSAASDQLLSYYSQVRQNENIKRLNPAFINSCIRLNSCRRNPAIDFEENAVRENNEFLSSHMDILCKTVIHQHLINTNQLFNLTLHFEQVSTMWADSGFGYESFKTLLMTYYLRKSFQDAIELIESNISFFQSIQNEKSMISIDLRELILGIYLSEIDEQLKINADICPLLTAINNMMSLPLFMPLHQSLGEIYSLYRGYYLLTKPPSQKRMIQEKLPELPEKERDINGIDPPLSFLDINLQFSIFLKLFLVKQEDYRDFIVNWGTLSTDFDGKSTLFIMLSDDTLKKTAALYNELSEQPHSCENAADELSIYIESYIYQLISIINQIPHIEFFELLEVVPVKKRFEELTQLIVKNHIKFKNYLLLHQFIHFMKKWHSVIKATSRTHQKDDLEFFDREISKSIYTQIKNLIYQKYGPLEIYYWLYSDRNVIDEVNFWIEQI